MIQLIIWEQFHCSYREYLIYEFNDDGTPSQDCFVRHRGQGCPHSHLLTLVKDGEAILNQQRGRNMKDGTYILPKQFYHVKGSGGFVEFSCEKIKTSDKLPGKVWFQYGEIRILWKKNESYVPVMDISPNKNSAYVYQPSRIII